MTLGRGLQSLIPQKELALKRGKILMVSVDDIDPNPDQPRTHFEAKSLQSLADSIKEHGVLQPVLVRKSKTDPSRYNLIIGERRWRAAKMAGLAEIPAILREMSKKENVEVALIENIQRQDLSYIEQANAFAYMRDKLGMSMDEMSKKVGLAEPTIKNFIRMLQLPKHIQQAIEQGKVSGRAAREIISLPSAEQERVFQKMLSDRITTNEVERMAVQVRGGRAQDRRKADADKELILWQKELRDHLNLNAVINMGVSGSGQLRIPYNTRADLAKLRVKLLS